MNELEKKTVEDIEHELEVSKQFPYLHKPREVAKQLVLRCGYGKIKQYQKEIDNLELQLKVAKQDKANLERTIEEIREALSANGITIDSDGNVNDSRVEEAKKQTAKAIIGELKGEMAIATYTFNPMLASELKTIYLRLEKEYGVEVDE